MFPFQFSLNYTFAFCTRAKSRNRITQLDLYLKQKFFAHLGDNDDFDFDVDDDKYNGDDDFHIYFS